MALMLGAFWYMRREVIDVLMIGLPMNTYERYADYLKNKLTGHHAIPNFKSGNRGGDLGDTISVHVRTVMVVAQPVGALTVATVERPDLRRANALVLDLGFNTLDMLGLSGGKPRMDRAAAFPGGVAAYIDDIRKSFNEWVKTTHAQELAIPHHHFEEALRDNKPLQCMLGELPLDPHVKKAAARLDQYMDLVAAKLGEAGDISVAVLAGGGAALMVEPFKRKYPLLRNIIVVKDPQFAIVLGYQEIGEKLAARFVAEAVGG
jgi:plasmid segregation protein ParM